MSNIIYTDQDLKKEVKIAVTELRKQHRKPGTSIRLKGYELIYHWNGIEGPPPSLSLRVTVNRLTFGQPIEDVETFFTTVAL